MAQLSAKLTINKHNTFTGITLGHEKYLFIIINNGKCTKYTPNAHLPKLSTKVLSSLRNRLDSFSATMVIHEDAKTNGNQ